MTFSALLKQSTFEDLSSFWLHNLIQGKKKYIASIHIAVLELYQELIWSSRFIDQNTTEIIVDFNLSELIQPQNRLQWKFSSIVHSCMVEWIQANTEKKVSIQVFRETVMP